MCFYIQSSTVNFRCNYLITTVLDLLRDSWITCKISTNALPFTETSEYFD
jgi:hypothetical protein